LFVDESGNFDLDDGAIDVAGVLVEVGSPATQLETRARLQSVAPDVPWPLHASVLNRPLAYAVWAEASPTSATTPAAKAAAKALRAVEPQVWAAAVTRAKKGKSLKGAQRISLEAACSRHSAAAYGTLREHARETYRRVQAEIRAIAAENRSQLFVFPTGETKAGDGRQDTLADEPIEDTYRVLLCCLFQRVADALGKIEGTHTVDLRVLRRNVRTASGRVTALELSHVTEEASRALEPLKAAGQTSVVLHPVEVREFDHNVVAPFVLADFAANACLRPVSASLPLSEVEPLIRDRIGLQLFVGAERNTHLSAAGRAQRFVNMIRRERGAGARLRAARLKTWAKQQATAWANLVVE
jgi:hypothetical protein